MVWEDKTEEKFRKLISKIPVFHRHITESVVIREAENNAQKRGASQVEESDVVAAFFSDVPSPFYSMMLRLLEQNGFDYKACGYPKNK
jgi:peptidoglycan/xylan/chitin deacetylase (PgdA/CDA1 family)